MGVTVSSPSRTRQPLIRSASVLRRGREAVRERTHPRTDAEMFDLDISPVWETVPGDRATPGRRLDTVLRRTLGIADVLAAFAALLFVARFVSGGSISLRLPAILLVPFVITASKALGLYDRDQHIVRKTTIDEIPAVTFLAVLYTMTVWLAESIVMRGALTRPQVFALIVSSLVAFIVARLLARGLTGAATDPERCMVLGNGEDAARVTSKLESAPGVKSEVVGRMPLNAADGGVRSRYAGGTEPWGSTLARVIAEKRIDRIIIAPDDHDQDDVLHVIRLIKAMGVKVSVLPRLLEVVGSSSTFEDVDGMTLLGVRQYGVSTSSRLLKRLMDIIGALIGILLLAPLLVVLAVAIKLDSRGPVFFRQRRIGRAGIEFEMLKFRSMVPDADAIKHELLEYNEAAGGLFKIAEDPRITRVGRFLRRTSLDELPQLFNVLGGSMSLVGPRPLVQDEDALIEGWQRRRLAVNPGMTGMWQIFGSSRIPMNEMVKIDYLYGANWSLWLDLKILLRTVPYVLRRRGL